MGILLSGMVKPDTLVEKAVGILEVGAWMVFGCCGSSSCCCCRG